MITEAKALVITLATKPGVDLHDVSTSACTLISNWQDKVDQLGFCPLHSCPQGSQVPLDLAQVLPYHVIGAHVLKHFTDMTEHLYLALY